VATPAGEPDERTNERTDVMDCQLPGVMADQCRRGPVNPLKIPGRHIARDIGPAEDQSLIEQTTPAVALPALPSA